MSGQLFSVVFSSGHVSRDGTPPSRLAGTCVRACWRDIPSPRMRSKRRLPGSPPAITITATRRRPPTPGQVWSCSERKSFDYRVLNRLMYKITGTAWSVAWHKDGRGGRGLVSTPPPPPLTWQAAPRSPPWWSSCPTMST